MFSRYRSHLEAEILRLEAAHKLQLLDKEKQVNYLLAEIERLRGENERMKIALLPFTKQGAAYVFGHPKQDRPAPKTSPDAERGWTAYLNRKIKEAEELEKQAKEQANGLQGERRDAVHEQADGEPAQHQNAADGGAASRRASATVSAA